MQAFHCRRCAAGLSFEDAACRVCGDPLGYRPDLLSLVNASPDGAEPFPGWRRCAEFSWGCNWLVADGEPYGQCEACRINRRVPPRDDTIAWEQLARAARAKRRLVHQLRGLGLPLVNHHDRPDGGLAFDLLSSSSGGRVVIGHANGVISIDLAESSDAHRESIRLWLDESYRTMLGHFRHEIGHYYWQVLIPGTPWETPFREAFGDERESYSEALHRHYRRDPHANWAETFITPYASAHPWEDFAEVWAHYLHIADTLQTAVLHGFWPDPRATSTGAPRSDLDPSELPDVLRQWGDFAWSFNELNRSMGKADPYPFTIAPAVAEKIGFVHRLIRSTRTSAAPSAETDDG